MIFLKISNASELIASKLGGFVEKLTPDSVDQSTIEDIIINKMIDSLKEEGLKGEISSANNVTINDNGMLIGNKFKIRVTQKF